MRNYKIITTPYVTTEMIFGGSNRLCDRFTTFNADLQKAQLKMKSINKMCNNQQVFIWHLSEAVVG